MRRFAKLSVGILALLILTSTSGRSGALGPGQGKKNLKVLTGMSDADMTQTMQEWTKALGTKCSFCHTLGDYASDEVDKKETARRMATMVRTINRDFLKGEKKASCILCHRGSTTPDPTSN